MAIKLIKACRELNVGMLSIVEWCRKNGYSIDNDPNVRIDDDLYNKIAASFRTNTPTRRSAIPTPSFTSREEVVSATDEEIKKFFADTVFEGVFFTEVKSKKKDAFKGHIANILLHGKKTDIVNTFVNVPFKSNDIPEGPCSFKCWMNIEAYREDSSKYFVNVDGTTLTAIEPKDEYVAPKSMENPTEKDLFEIWGLTDKEIIGYYHAREDYFIVDDIRKTNFDHIPYYPEDEDKRPIELYVPKPLKGLSPDNYYIFTWKLSNNKPSNPYEIWIDYNFPPRKIEPSWFIHKLFDDRYEDKSRNFGSTTNFLDTLSKQLSAKESTFVYELLQNANDYPKGEDPVDVEFHILDKHLIFMHSGDYFNVRNISGICGINEKEKAANKKAIGYKGIGFKTVFLNNHYVYIKTGAYSFRFDKSEQRPNGIIKRLDAPWQVLPIWTEQNTLNPEVAQSINSADPKFRVQIALRPDSARILHEGKNCYENIFREIFEDSNIILFIPHIRSVKVYIDGALVRNCLRNNEEWVVNDYEETIDDELIQFINKTIDTGKSRIPEKYKDFEATRVSFACKHQGRKLIPVNKANLYCYLPTKASWGFPFLMNTDMIPKGDRNDIETEVNLVDENETNFNLEIANIAGRQFFYWIRDLILSGKYEYESIFQLIPNFDRCISEHEDYEEFITKFREGFEELLEENPLIPIIENGETTFKLVNQIIYDTTGLSCSGLMSDEDILSLSEWSDFFPHPALRDTNQCDLTPCFKKFMETYHSSDQEYDIDNLVNVVTYDSFQGWLEIRKNNDGFIKLLVKKDIIDSFDESSIFLANDNTLHTPGDLYYDVSAYYKDISYFEDYLTRLSEDTKNLFVDDSIWENFTSNFLEFNPDNFVYDVLLDDSNFSDVHETLMSADNSLRFMHFLAEHVGYSNKYRSFPLVDENGDVIDSFDERDFTYFADENLVELRQRTWVDTDLFAVVSPKYDEKSLTYIKENFDVLEFTTQSFIEKYISSGDYVDNINDLIQEWSANKDFVNYLFANQACIHEGDLSPYYVGSVGDMGDEQYHIISETYLYLHDFKSKIKYESLPWIDHDMFVMVREDYFTDANQQKLTHFFERFYEIPVLNLDKFVQEVLENNVDDINNYIMDSEDANVGFWRWIKDNLGTQEKLSPVFQRFPVLAKSLNDESLDYYTTEQNNIFLSSAYQVSDDFEKIVSRYVPDTLFVAPYMESKTQASINAWKEFWGKVGIKTTIVDLVLDKIIYYLDEIQEEGLPDLLGQYYTEIQEKWEDIKSALLDIQLKTRGGNFVGIQEAIVIDVNKEKEPFDKIVIKDEVDPAIIGNRYTRKLLLDIAKEANSRIVENISDWQQYKINAYAGQEDEYDENTHISFVDELAQIDVETLKRFDNLDCLCLLDREGNYVNPSELTLGSLYKPECDFEKYGIDYNYISDKYYAANIGASLLTLIHKEILDVHYKFISDDIPALNSYDFSIYFWKDYARLHTSDVTEWLEDDLFDDVECVPTMKKTMASPNNLYSRRIWDYIEEKISDWESKVPSNIIPIAKDSSLDIFERLPFKDHLSLIDSLDALLNIKNRERRAEILLWMYEEYTDTDSKLISAYRGTKEVLWKNGKGQDKPLTELYALAPESSTLREFFCDNDRVLNRDYLRPAYIADKYRGVCEMMQIPIIEEEDMKFTPVSCQNENLAKFFVGRLLVVAAIEDQRGWNKSFAKYKEKLEKITFWRCDKIAWIYTKNDEIQQNSKRFYAQDDNFYYVGKWEGRQVYGSLIDALKEEVDSRLNDDLFSNIMDPDTNIDDILEDYYNIKTEEFISELAKYDINYHPEIISVDNDEDDDVSPTKKPKTIDYPIEEGEDVEEVDVEDEEPELEPKVREKAKNVNETPQVVPSVSATLNKEKTLVAGPGEEVVAEHYRSGTWVEAYIKDDGTYVSGHYRSDSIVSEHTRDVPETTRTTSSGRERTHDHTSEGEDQNRTQQTRSTSGSSSSHPQNSNWKREPHNYSKEELENMRSKGSPLELTTLPPTKEEIEILGRCGIAPEHISDTNYIAQIRLYQNLRDAGQEPEESLEDFVRNSSDVTEHKLKGGKYIHTCSAGRGVMYVSPSIWNKVMDDKCAICVYYGPHANQFFYINTPEDLLKLVEKDDVVIKITGQEKVNVVGALYNGLLKGVRGTAYTLIRVAAHTEMDTIFAHYVGDMAEQNDGNEPLNVEEY